MTMQHLHAAFAVGVPCVPQQAAGPLCGTFCGRSSGRMVVSVPRRVVMTAASVPTESPTRRPVPCPALGHEMRFTEVSGLRAALRGPRMALRLRGRAKRGTILTLRLGGELPEDSSRDSFFFARAADSPPSLPEVVRGLRLAAHDPRIAHLYMRVDRLTCGWGKVLEVRRMLEYFVDSGKSITVFMEGGSEKEYFLTCGLGNYEVFVPPEGTLSLRGFSAAGSFVRGVLEKIGVEPQVERIGAYKSAGDQLGRKSMSAEQRMVIENLLTQVQSMFVKTVAQCKSLEEDEVLALLDRGMQDMSEYAEAGLITAVKYEGDVIDDLKRRFKSKSTDDPEVDDEKILRRKLDAIRFPQYVRTTTEKMLGLGGRKKIAVIRASGAITSGKSGSSVIMGPTVGSESMVDLVNRVRDDESVKAVILRVDSPGGSALASDIIFNALGKLAKRKPVIASMVSVAASGGYYISMGLPIVAESATITGSIGVVTAKLSLEDLYRKIGFAKETLSKGRYAELEIDTRSFTPEEAAYFRSGTERAYKSFVSKAAEARGVDYDTMHEVAQGRVWTGQEAVERGLVDHIGGFWRAVEVAKEKAGISDDYVRLEEVRIPLSPLARLGLGASVGVESSTSSSVTRMITEGEVMALCELDASSMDTARTSELKLSPLQKIFAETLLHVTSGLPGGRAVSALVTSLFESKGA